LSIPFIHSSKNLITFNSNRFRKKKQDFYVKKEKKLSNVYHKKKPENQSSIYIKLKESETKPFLTHILNYFFKESLKKPSKSIKKKTLL